VVHVGGGDQKRRLVLLDAEPGERLADLAAQGEARRADRDRDEADVGPRDLQKGQLDLQRMLAAVRLGVLIDRRREREEALRKPAIDGRSTMCSSDHPMSPISGPSS